MYILRVGIYPDCVVYGAKANVLRRCTVGIPTRLVPVTF